MIDIAIAALPNQSLTIQLDERVYVIALKETNGVMAASITRDNVAIVTNVRVTAGTPLLPYIYQEAGNFVLLTNGDDLPYWDQFGVTQFLLYVTPSELAEYRA
jgi:hypothetical protein